MGCSWRHKKIVPARRPQQHELSLLSVSRPSSLYPTSSSSYPSPRSSEDAGWSSSSLLAVFADLEALTPAIMYGSQQSYSNPPQPEWRLPPQSQTPPQPQPQPAWQQPSAASPPPPASTPASLYNPINYGPMTPGTVTMGAPPVPGPGVDTTMWGVRYNQQQQHQEQQQQLNPYPPPPLPVSDATGLALISRY